MATATKTTRAKRAVLTEGSGDFAVYASGICQASVCTSLSIDEATERLNCELPTGISSQWRVSDESFHDGGANPRPCDGEPTTHVHLLFEC